MFGNLDEMQQKAEQRLQTLQERGMKDAQLYNPVDSSVGGLHAMFIVRGDPATYNLPPDPDVPTIFLKDGWTSSAIASGFFLLGAVLAFMGGRDGK
jgi:formate dehydrogenase iron-sulfur subunit